MNIVVIRFSALGDVALTSPVISSVLNSDPELHIWIISKEKYADLYNENDRLHFFGADLNGKHKGIRGLIRIVNEINDLTSIDAVVDLHDVLRTKIICRLFKIRGIQTISFHKGRNEKKQLINHKRPFEPLPHVTRRYLDAFSPLIGEVQLLSGPWIKFEEKNINLKFFNNNKNIGIAPFTAHKSKEWGLYKIKLLITQLPDHNILLFGGGKDEVNQLKEIEKLHSNCHSIAGKFSLKEELNIISRLNVMLCMDSANMHLASLTGVSVISIWGPTHHYLGFGPLNNLDNIVEISQSELPCRPCSIYGRIKTSAQKQCAKLSMELITVDEVVNKIKKITG